MEKDKERNTNMYHVWKKVVFGKDKSDLKAYESVKQCPITYDHPSELIRLNGIGIFRI